MVGRFRAVESCVRKRGNCLKYYEMGWNRKDGREKTFLKGGGGKLVDGVGALKKGGVGISSRTTVLGIENSFGKSWNFAKILEKSWKCPGIFLWSDSPKERFLSKHQHFSGFLCMLNLAFHRLTAVIFIWWMQ